MAARGISKAGPVTLAVGLIGAGLALLFYNLGAVNSLVWLWKLWPLLLIGVGLEYFIKKSFNREEEVHFHVPSLILILVLVMLGGAAYATANVGRNLDRILDGMPWYEGGQLDYARNWESGSIPVSSGQTLVVKNNVGQINLKPAENDALQVQAAIRSPRSGPARELADGMQPEIIQAEDTITVHVPDTGNRTGAFSRVVTDLTVLVPRGVAVQVHSVTGRVTADGLDAGLKLDGNTGSVELVNVSGKVEVHNNTGRIEIKNPGGDVAAETHTGSIEMSSEVPLAGNYKLTSSTGRVYLKLPADSDLKLDAVSRTGSISVTGLTGGSMHRDGPRSEYSHTMGSGKGVARLDVATGAIQIVVP